MKLIFEASRVASKCQLCKRFEVTWRKIAQAKERVDRWEAEGINPVSTDKEKVNIGAWQKELKEIEMQRQSRMRTV